MSRDVLARQIMTAVLALTLACGDSDEPTSAASGTGGAAVTGGTGGTGGGGDAAGTSGQGGTGGSTMDAGVTTMSTDFTCGTMTCTTPDLIGQTGLDAGAAGSALGIDPAMLSGIGVTGCCTPNDTCGVENSMLFSGCREQDMPGTPDDACPTIEIVYSTEVPFALSLAGTIPPCCNSQVGECGLDLSAVSLDLGVVGNLIGVTEPLDVNIGLGCLPLSDADSIRGDSIEIITDAGTAEALSCGSFDDAGS